MLMLMTLELILRSGHLKVWASVHFNVLPLAFLAEIS